MVRKNALTLGSQIVHETLTWINVFSAVGHDISFSWLADNIKKGQDYLLHNTTLGIPALVQTEGKPIIIPASYETTEVVVEDGMLITFPPFLF